METGKNESSEKTSFLQVFLESIPRIMRVCFMCVWASGRDLGICPRQWETLINDFIKRIDPRL